MVRQPERERERERETKPETKRGGENVCVLCERERVGKKKKYKYKKFNYKLVRV